MYYGRIDEFIWLYYWAQQTPTIIIGRDIIRKSGQGQTKNYVDGEQVGKGANQHRMERCVWEATDIDMQIMKLAVIVLSLRNEIINVCSYVHS